MEVMMYLPVLLGMVGSSKYHCGDGVFDTLAIVDTLW